MGQSNTKETLQTSQSSNLTRTSTNDSVAAFKPKKHLSKVELVSLRCIFNDLKSTFQDRFECIEIKQFLVNSDPHGLMKGVIDRVHRTT